MFIFIIGLAAFIVLFLAYSMLTARSNKKARLKQITDLIEQAEAGQLLAIDYVYKGQLRKQAVEFKLIDRYEAIAANEKQARQARDVGGDAAILEGSMHHLIVWHDRSKRPELRLDALDRFINALRRTRHNVNRRIFLATLLGVQADKLPQIITDDDAHGATDRFRYRRYRDFIHQLSYTAGKEFDDFCSLQIIIETWNKSVGSIGYKFLYPAGWNTWVVRHKAIPSFNDFVGLQNYGDLPIGTISKRMAQAIRTSDVVELAITLSYCNLPKPYWQSEADWRRCRNEVGDVLYAEAVKLYEVLRALNAHVVATA